MQMISASSWYSFLCTVPSGGRFFGVGLEHNSDDIGERLSYPSSSGRADLSGCFRL